MSSKADQECTETHQLPGQQAAQDAVQAATPVAEDLPAPTTQQQPAAVSDQPPAKSKKGKKKAKAAAGDLQGACPPAAVKKNNMGKKRKKHSDDTPATATKDLQGTLDTSAAVEHIPLAASEKPTQAVGPAAMDTGALADIPAAGASQPGQLFSRCLTGI